MSHFSWNSYCRMWAHLTSDDRPPARRRNRVPFEGPGCSLAGWCAEEVSALVAVLMMVLAERQRPVLAVILFHTE